MNGVFSPEVMAVMQIPLNQYHRQQRNQTHRVFAETGKKLAERVANTNQFTLRDQPSFGSTSGKEKEQPEGEQQRTRQQCPDAIYDPLVGAGFQRCAPYGQLRPPGLHYPGGKAQGRSIRLHRVQRIIQYGDFFQLPAIARSGSQPLLQVRFFIPGQPPLEIIPKLFLSVSHNSSLASSFKIDSRWPRNRCLERCNLTFTVPGAIP